MGFYYSWAGVVIITRIFPYVCKCMYKYTLARRDRKHIWSITEKMDFSLFNWYTHTQTLCLCLVSAFALDWIISIYIPRYMWCASRKETVRLSANPPAYSSTLRALDTLSFCNAFFQCAAPICVDTKNLHFT